MTVTAKIVPVQDLHGQASPYPAGGGKNLLPYPYGYFPDRSKVINDVTVTNLGDGRLKFNGTEYAGFVLILVNKANWTSQYDQPAGTYTFSCDFTNVPSGVVCNFQMVDGSDHVGAEVT